MAKKPRNFPVFTKEVRGLTVRGLSLNDVAILGGKFGPAMTKLFKTAAAQEGMSQAAMTEVVKSASEDFPDVIGAVIALACDMFDADGIKTANDMPMGVQIEYLEAVFNATFQSESDIAKMIESLSRMLEKVSGVMETAPLLGSVTGTGTSADK